MEWNGGMTTGVEHWTGLLECHAHKLVAYLARYLGMRIILSRYNPRTALNV